MSVRGGRFLLNLPGVQSTAAIVAEVEDTRRWLTDRFRKGDALSWDDDTAWNLSPETMLKVSDCDRSVQFAIEWQSARHRRAALLKVDRLIEALTAFREGLAEEQRLYVVRCRAARLAGPPPKKPEDEK